MQQLNVQRVLPEVEEDLRFDANVRPPSVLEVLMPRPQPIVPTVDGTATEGRVLLDARIAKRNHALDVAPVERFDATAMELHVLLRHLSSP